MADNKWTEYDIKKGWFKNIEGDLLSDLMKEVFGNVKPEGDQFVSSYGVLSRIEVKPVAKDKMLVSTEADKNGANDDTILDSKRKLNAFLEKATGFNSKTRMKRAQAKAKKGVE